MEKDAISFAPLFKLFSKLAPRAGKAATKAIPATGGAAEKTLPKSIPIIQDVKRTLPDALRRAGAAGQAGKNGKTTKQVIDGLGAGAKRDVSKAFKNDLKAVEDEIARLRGLKGTTNPEELAAIQNRMKELQRVRTSLENNVRNFRRTAVDKFLRAGGDATHLGFMGLDLGYFTPKMYEDMKNGNYGSAALTAGEALLLNTVPLARFSRFRRLAAPGRALANMGERSRGLTGWMMRHPVLSAEAVGTPIGMNTQLSEIMSGKGEDIPVDIEPDTPVAAANSRSDEAFAAQNSDATESEMMRRRRLRGGM